ncbi:MAG TPA: hypothetical protein VKW76_11195 [Candidatus Binatia bacterium]|nr:hypothetical protein [Candidatus Binatia bacterium]
MSAGRVEAYPFQSGWCVRLVFAPDGTHDVEWSVELPVLFGSEADAVAHGTVVLGRWSEADGR